MTLKEYVPIEYLFSIEGIISLKCLKKYLSKVKNISWSLKKKIQKISDASLN